MADFYRLLVGYTEPRVCGVRDAEADIGFGRGFCRKPVESITANCSISLMPSQRHIVHLSELPRGGVGGYAYVRFRDAGYVC